MFSFLFIWCVLVFYSLFVYCFRFPKSVLLYLRIQFHQCWIWKKHLYVDLVAQKCLWDQEILVTFSLQPAELYYILLVFLCWMENSCSRSLHVIAFLSQSWSTAKKMAAINITSLNKNDVQHFPPKWLVLNDFLLLLF